MPLFLSAYQLVMNFVFPSVTTGMVAKHHSIVCGTEPINSYGQSFGKVSVRSNEYYNFSVTWNFRKFVIKNSMAEYSINMGDFASR